LNIRDYYWAMDNARNYLREGNIELAEESFSYAHSRIRNIFIALFFSFLFHLFFELDSKI